MMQGQIDRAKASPEDYWGSYLEEKANEMRERIWTSKKLIKELERQLASSNKIRKAEKKILIQEIAKNKELQDRIEELEGLIPLISVILKTRNWKLFLMT